MIRIRSLLPSRRRTIFLSGAVGATLAAVLGWIAVSSWQEAQLRTALRENVLRAQHSRDRGAAYRAMVQDLERSSLEQLERDLDEGIALMAAFALHNVRIPPANDLDREHAERFLQFFKHRTRLDPPAWWAKHLPELNPSVTPDELPQAHLDIGDVEVRVSIGDGRLLIPSEVFRLIAAPTLARHTTAVIGAERSFLATYDDVGKLFPLISVQSQPGLPIWQTESWALGADNLDDLSGRRWVHAAQLVLDGPWVIVWGAGTGGSYVEVFDSDDGANRFRFSTNYWFAP